MKHGEMKPVDPGTVTVHPEEGEVRGFTHQSDGRRPSQVCWPRGAERILEVCPNVERAPWSAPSQ